MVIQSFNVSASSQRSFLSVQSATASTPTQVAGASTQVAENSSHQATWQQNQNGQGANQNGQGQNGNGNGNNGNGNGNSGNNGNGNTGLGQNGNNPDNIGLGHNQNGNGNIGLGQTKNGNGNNGQGQNVDNQGPGKDEIFKDALKNAKHDRDVTLDRMARGSRASRMMKGRHHKMPSTPLEFRSTLSQLIYEILSGKNLRLKPTQHAENFNQWRDFDIFSSFGGVFGNGSMEHLRGLEGLQFESFQFESETVTYQATGEIHTADGKTINIDINVEMSRQFVSYMGLSTRSSTLVDPIVINYGGTAASLMNEKFQFDLTMDGNMDSLSVLGEGSGFLAIDWNGDGKINDGSELFGPSTGCGFNELRKYDTDGNGWIDANDEIFDKLVVWRRDENGNDTVKTLKELGIGAIFLGDISTEFSFKGDNNETLGVMRSTSFFIKECGGAGTLSHIDLAL